MQQHDDDGTHMRLTRFLIAATICGAIVWAFAIRGAVAVFGGS